MKKYFVLLVLGVCVLVGVVLVQVVGVVEDVVKCGILWVGMDLIYMLFEMINKCGQIIGFEVDLFKVMVKFMGVKLELVFISYDGIILVLLIDKFDMIGLGMILIQECNLCLNFFEFFIVVGQILLVCKELEGKIKFYKDLNDLQYSIILKIGIIGEIVVCKLISKVKYYGFDNELEVVMDVVNGKVDVFIYDLFYNVVVVSKFGVGKLVYFDQLFIYELLVFGLKKGDYDSINFINNFFYQICEDGIYQCIYDKWFKNIEWLKEME